MTAFIYASDDRKEWVRDNIWLYYVSIVFGLGLLCSLICCVKNARKVPLNYILLGTFTICWSYMVAGITQFYEPQDVLVAASLTFAMVVGLTLFACCTKMKLNWLFGIGAAISVAIWPLIIFMWIFPSSLLFNIIAFLVVIMTSIYIVWDTKMIMSEKKGFSTDDYIIAALILYVDIVQLFIWLLSLLGQN